MSRLTAKLFKQDNYWIVEWGASQIHSWGLPDTLLNLPQGQQDLVIDLTETKYIDSQGLEFLLGLHKKLSDQNVHIILQNPNLHLRRLFRIMQFERIFEIELTS